MRASLVVEVPDGVMAAIFIASRLAELEYGVYEGISTWNPHLGHLAMNCKNARSHSQPVNTGHGTVFPLGQGE